MQRRHFLGLLGAGGVAGLMPGLALARPQLETQRAAGIEPLDLSEAQWRERLTDVQFGVLRKADTESAGSSPLNGEKRSGVYRCAGCDLALFDSETKFESGTGWPSFYDHIEGHLLTERDFVMLFPRTEYHCARCGGHQGHVFEDGPEPTGLRWCNNGVALRFEPRQAGSA